MNSIQKIGVVLIVVGILLMISPLFHAAPLAMVGLTIPDGGNVEIAGISENSAIHIGVGGFLVLVGAGLVLKGGKH